MSFFEKAVDHFNLTDYDDESLSKESLEIK